MDKELKELEQEFARTSNLLRVQAFVKQLKKEHLNEEVLRLIATTYTIIQQAKNIAKDFNQLNSRRTLTDEEHHQHSMFEDALKDMLKDIREANEKFDSEINLTARSCVFLSVLNDLDEATTIFKEVVAFGQNFNAL